VLRRETLDPLGVEVAVLAVPRGLSAQRAVRRLRELDPAGSFDYDHLYFGSGAVSPAAADATAAASASRSRARAGLVDTGVDARHPALAGAEIAQRGFAPGGPAPGAHGTATASLIAGSADGFRGSAPGASLFVADVYGRGGAGGSAESLARALAWMAEVRAPVVNVSLVGPDNRLLAATVHALTARGQVVVAAVGNDGPAAPPMYPASYPDVVAVSAVDAHGRPLLEAGRASHVDFCAPGADMAAAAPGTGYAVVRGASFAAPIVAGLLAREMGAEPGRGQAALDAAAKAALSPSGDRKACGRGVVGGDLRVDPKAVGARRALEP
jgi:Subtilase family